MNAAAGDSVGRPRPTSAIRGFLKVVTVALDTLESYLLRFISLSSQWTFPVGSAANFGGSRPARLAMLCSGCCQQRSAESL